MSKEEQKARELVESMYKEMKNSYSGCWEVAKSQAVICIDYQIEFISNEMLTFNYDFRKIYIDELEDIKEIIKSL